MLLQALHQYADRRKLLDRLPFQVRTVHLVIPLKLDGTPRGNGFNLLTHVQRRSVKGVEKVDEKPGKDVVMPRFPGEKNNTKAQYLADPVRVVLGLGKDTLAPLDESGKKPSDAVRQFRMFWEWIESAAERLQGAGTPDTRLNALLLFRRNHLNTVRQWVSVITPPGSKTGKPEAVAKLAGGLHRLKDGDVTGFTIGTEPLVVANDRGGLSEIATEVLAVPLWQDWSNAFEPEFRKQVGDPRLGVTQESLCLVTGDLGRQVAQMHKPEIKVSGTPPKGAAFFSCGSAAFNSYGLSDGANATVSVEATASYSLALEDLIASDRTSLGVAGVTFCYWSERDPAAAERLGRMHRTASPREVAEFLKEVFAGVERPIKVDRFHAVSLSANGGRIMVRDWIDVPLKSAEQHFGKWFRDLDIAPLADAKDADDGKGGPYSLFRLAAACVRESGELDRMSDAVAALYRAAYTGSAPPLRLLEPILSEFRSALVTDAPPKKPKYPLSQSRFALVKLLLIRHPNPETPVPKVFLATESPDQAYNLGRLLCIFARLQKQAHDGKLEGPGVVQRYYAAAAAAPLNVFPVLVNLHQNHLRKLEQGGTKGVRRADSFRAVIGDVLKRIPSGTDGLPAFKSTLKLEEQARFALGYYQQHAYDRAAGRVGHLIKLAAKAYEADKPEEADAHYAAAQVAVSNDDYPDLAQRVAAAQTRTKY